MTDEQETTPAEPVRVGVLGARGRMGMEVCKAVDAANDMDLVAMVDQGDWLFNASDAGAEVVVDFTTPDVVMDNLHWCIDQGINAVVGTTGFTEQRLDRVRGWLARQARRGRGDRAELRHRRGADDGVRRPGGPATSSRSRSSSMHHPRKLDAPSGTAHAHRAS